MSLAARPRAQFSVAGPRLGAPLLAALALVVTSGLADAQPTPPASASAAPAGSAPAAQTAAPQLPPGHPPIDGVADDTGDEDEAAPSDLPPGHPPVDGAPAGMGGPPRGRSFAVDDPGVPTGTIALQVRVPSGKPPAGATANLKIRHQTVAAGTTTTHRAATLDAEGRARFEGLTVGSEWVYGVSLEYAGVPYDVPMFQFAARAGKRVEMTVYETTDDMDAAPVGTQAIMYLEPRETAFQVEQLFRFSNIGDKTWRCEGMVVNLPRGFKAFSEDDEHGSLEATEVSGRGVRISGYVAPGVTQVIIRYQLPFPDSDTARLEFGMPARVGHLRVIGAIPPSMGMRVDNLPPPEDGEGNEGRHLKITETAVPVGGDQIELAVVNLTGLPTKPQTRWYALGLSLAAMVSGLVVALRQRGRDAGEDRMTQWNRARDALLEELEALERAHRAGDVGPRTYEQARRNLIGQLTALIASKPEPGKAAG